MGDVVEFRPKRLSGFIPEASLNSDALGQVTQSALALAGMCLLPLGIGGHNLTNDTACSEINPDSGDCA